MLTGAKTGREPDLARFLEEDLVLGIPSTLEGDSITSLENEKFEFSTSSSSSSAKLRRSAQEGGGAFGSRQGVELLLPGMV